MLWYSVKRENWNITIKKEQRYKNTGLIKYWLVKRDSCDNTFKEKVFAKTYLSSTNVNEVNIDLQKLINDQIAKEKDSSAEKDLYGQGVYELHFVLVESKKTGVEEKNERVLGGEATKTFTYYPQILESLVDDLESVLCGCPCSNCDGCVDDKKLLNVTTKVLLYYTLSGEYYQSKFGQALNCVSCSLSKEAICILLNEQIRGGSELNKRFLKKILAIFYISFYLMEVGRNCTVEENGKVKDWTTDFHFDKVKRCLEGLGIDLDCIRKHTDNSEARYADFPFYVGRNVQTIDYRYFNDHYSDFEDEEINQIMIYDINHGDGELRYNGTRINNYAIIDFSEIIAGKLTYQANGSGNTEANFKWKVSEGCRDRFNGMSLIG
jgi:hypothetical protein|nr:MAG TPA: hypothetical protein [Caudoviricetes sp.]